MKIVLLGYMASGKTTVGKQLSKLLQYNFIDLDSYIEAQEKLSIPEVFQKKGAIYFRKKEAVYLRQILNKNKPIVLSTGGGTPCYGNNLSFILKNKQHKSYYLKVPNTILAKRLVQEKAHRPLVSSISTEEKMLEFVGKHIFERKQYYEQANYSINANTYPKAIVEAIVATLY